MLRELSDEEYLRCWHKGDIMRNDWCSDDNPLRYTVYVGREGSRFLSLDYRGRIVRHMVSNNKMVKVGHMDSYDAFIKDLEQLDKSRFL